MLSFSPWRGPGNYPLLRQLCYTVQVLVPARRVSWTDSRRQSPMAEPLTTRSAPTSRRKIFRKSLVIPAEHGAWSWLLVPYVVGALVASQVESPADLPILAGLLILVGGLSAYMVRQPVTVWLRIQQGRGRRSDAPLAASWSIALATLAGLCLVGLLALGRTDLLWLVFPVLAVAGLYLLSARRGRASLRSLGMELTGAVGLALMAPAASAAISGQLDQTAWILWGLMALQNALGVLYVRQRLADTHGRPSHRGLTLWGHGVALLALGTAAIVGWLPWLAVLPFAGFLARAVWAVGTARPVANVRRFGFGELAVEILGGLIIVAAFLGTPQV